MTKRKQSLDIDVEGLSTEEILNMDVNDINRMNYRTIRALGSRLVSSMNKRIRSLEAKTPDSMALHSLPQGFRFSTKGKNRNEIRSLIGQMQKFGKMKTSTVRGWRAYRKSVEKIIGGKLSQLQDETKFWSTFRRIKETNGVIFQRVSSDEILKMTYDVAIEDSENIFERMQEILDEIYEEMEKERKDDIWGDFDEDDEDYF